MRRGLVSSLIALLLASPLSGGWAQEEGDVKQLWRQIGELRDQGHQREGLPLAQRALLLAEQRYGPEAAETATSATWLANVLQDCGEFDKAKPLLERALAINEKLL